MRWRSSGSRSADKVPDLFLYPLGSEVFPVRTVTTRSRVIPESATVGVEQGTGSSTGGVGSQGVAALTATRDAARKLLEAFGRLRGLARVSLRRRAGSVPPLPPLRRQPALTFARKWGNAGTTVPHSPSAKPLSKHDASAKSSPVCARKRSPIWGMRSGYSGTTIGSIVKPGAF